MIFDAFQSLITQVLTEDVDAWRAQILAAIGGMEYAQLLIDAIPSLELVIGAAPPLAAFQPAEASNIFNRLFVSFVSVFAKPTKPLIVFIDDGQWADGMSLSLLKLLFAQRHLTLLLITAYRSNEVFPSHPLMVTIREAAESEAHDVEADASVSASASAADGADPPPPPSRITEIQLEPLTATDCMQLVADTLRCAAPRTRPLVDMLYRQTNGSPFFFILLLSAYYKYGWISFDWLRAEWQWDLSAVRLGDISELDSVVALLQQQVAQLPSTQQEVLVSAACIGNRFHLHTLAIIHECSQQQMARQLWPLILSGLIVPLGSAAEVFSIAEAGAPHEPQTAAPASSPTPISDRLPVLSGSQPIVFRFLHDSVQQASYQLLDVQSRPARHLRIARLLYAESVRSGLLNSQATDIVEQFNTALDLITEAEELQQVVGLNQIAAAKAKASTAFQRCNHYCKIAYELLQRLRESRSKGSPPSAVSANPYLRLGFSVLLTLADSYYLISDFAQAEKTALILVDEAAAAMDADPGALMEQASALELLVIVYAAQNARLSDSMDAAMRCLALLHITLLEWNSAEAATVLQRDVRDLVSASDATDARHLLVMRLCNSILAVAWVSGRLDLRNSVIVTMLNQAYQFGVSIFASAALIFHGGAMASGDFKDLQVEAAIQTQRVRAMTAGKKLLDRFSHSLLTSGALRCKTMVAFYAVAAPWYQPFSRPAQGFRAAWSDCLESAEYEYGQTNTKRLQV